MVRPINRWLGPAGLVRPRERRLRQQLRHFSDRTAQRRNVDVYSIELTARHENYLRVVRANRLSQGL
jgi:hypothetical protein